VTGRGRVASLVGKLRSYERGRWWVSFSIVAALGALWALGTPPTASPDEETHVIRAAALARGELVGRPLTSSQRDQFFSRVGSGGWEGGSTVTPYRSVTVPEIYDRPNWGCYVKHPERSAACLDFSGPQRDASVVTNNWYPPAYYAWVGLVARTGPAGARAVYVMRLAAVVIAAALLASAVATLRRVADTPLVNLGLLAAVTPTALFLAGSVHASGLEIAAGLALWVSGAVLVSEARASGGGRVDSRLVARVGMAAGVLVLSRQLGPLWAGLILLILAGLAGRQGIRALRWSRAVWTWGAVVGACLISTLAWIVGVGALDKDKYLGAPTNESLSQLVRGAIGDSFAFFREMIGVFGWNDLPAPTLTLLVWTAVLGGLAALAVAFGRRRETIAMLVVGVLAAVLPVVIVVAQSDYGGWFGRYTMPFALGVPVLAGLALRGPALHRVPRGAVLLAGGALVAGHVLAYAEVLRRYTVGAGGTVWFWTNPAWSPPVPPLLLLLGAVAATVAWAIWLLVPEWQNGPVAPLCASHKVPRSWR
jgi:Predicted membrane protein (DUF2142)